jgi:hypothetical protein
MGLGPSGSPAHWVQLRIESSNSGKPLIVSENLRHRQRWDIQQKRPTSLSAFLKFRRYSRNDYIKRS